MQRNVKFIGQDHIWYVKLLFSDTAMDVSVSEHLQKLHTF